MPVVFGKKTQFQHVFEQLETNVGLGLAATGENWSEQCAMVTMQCYIYLRNSQNKTCNIGARLHVWLNSMLAGLTKYKDGYSRASITGTMPPNAPTTPKKRAQRQPLQARLASGTARYAKRSKAFFMYRQSESPATEMICPSAAKI